ncbi:MAG: cob(I)yrinic acid a,c-diamide adenosyltransferase [Bdellovibrionota bacterium]
MKIYTKTGDEGKTGLFGGGRVSKAAPRIAAYGDVDELNAVVGIAHAESRHEPLRKALVEVQNTLFTIGGQLATPDEEKQNFEVVTSAHIDSLERQMDVISETLPELKHFILPGGSKVAASLHLARTVCRRAERSVVALGQLPGEHVDRWLLIYMNRLSDFLFVLARLANQLEKCEDTIWIANKKN